MAYADVVKEFRRIKASDLVPNEKNWRLHPTAQQEAMKGILEEVGIADVCLVYEVDGKFKICDGHLRKDLLGDQEIPCVVLDVTEQEAEKLLLTHDALTGMAATDGDMLLELASSAGIENEALSGLIEGITDKYQDVAEPDVPEEEPEEPSEVTVQANHTCPKCGHQWCGAAVTTTKE